MAVLAFAVPERLLATLHCSGDGAADVRGIDRARAVYCVLSIRIEKMDLPDRSTASPFSEEKQQRLAQQSLDTVMTLAAKGVGEIALFLAAPGSVALRFSTVYHRRNLPQIVVN